MKSCRYEAAIVAAILLIGTVCANAAVVTVTPENVQGWSIVTHQGATADLANYGYAAAQREKPWIADDGTNLGKGAYYATLSEAGGQNNTPSTAWLGCDTFNGLSLVGVSLSRIKALEYYALNAHFPTISGSDWTSYTYWEYSRQPIQLQLTAQSPDGTDREQFWCLPFEPVGFDPSKSSFLRGDKGGINTNKWLRIDCIEASRCQGASIIPFWYCPKTKQAFQTWAELIAYKPDPNGTTTYGDYTLVPTSNDPYPTGWKSAGWDDQTTPIGRPECTATGMCLNFQAGARKYTGVDVYGTEVIQWGNDSHSFRGYIDRFTLAIDYGQPGTANVVQTTYDFEPSAGAAPPQVVCMTVDAAYDTIINTVNETRWKKVIAKVVGRVVKHANPRFWMSDPWSGTVSTSPQILCPTFEGAPMAALTHLWQDDVRAGDYVSVIGILELPPITANLLCVWSSPSKLGLPAL